MLNLAILIGRLTADPELRYTPNGTAVATFTIATDRFGKEGEKETTFIPIVAWRKQAENCANYLGKGSLAAVDGRMQVRSYDAKDGTRRWVTEVVADTVRFLDKKGERSGGGFEERPAGNDIGFSDEDIPF